MRTFYRVEIPRYGPARQTAQYEYEIQQTGLTTYLIAAASLEEAISKVPPAESRKQISKVVYEGQMVVVD